jgi:hypothetical protein
VPRDTQATAETAGNLALFLRLNYNQHQDKAEVVLGHLGAAVWLAVAEVLVY